VRSTAITGLNSSSEALNSIWLAVAVVAARERRLCPCSRALIAPSTPYVASQDDDGADHGHGVDDDVVGTVPLERIGVAGVQNHRSGREGEPDLPERPERFAHPGPQPNSDDDDRRACATIAGPSPSRAGRRR